MAVEMHDHIHLGTANPPVTTYKVVHGSLDTTPLVFATPRRALNGKLHMHRLTSAGDPVQFRGDSFRIRATLAEMLVLRGLVGKPVEYVPNYHDDDAIAGYQHTVYLMATAGSFQNLDPASDYWYVNLQIVDDEAV